jgi:hypothetical protein
MEMQVRPVHEAFPMIPSRRKLLLALGALGIPSGFLVTAGYSQSTIPRRPSTADGKGDADSNAPNIDSKNILEANQKDIKKNVERLFQLATELKAEVDKTDEVKVLSVALLKKAEEIEKLAHSIRSRALG